MKVRREYGSLGQFDVVVDGEVVAGRTRGGLRKILGGGFPDPEDVVEKIAAKQVARRDAPT